VDVLVARRPCSHVSRRHVVRLRKHGRLAVAWSVEAKGQKARTRAAVWDVWALRRPVAPFSDMCCRGGGTAGKSGMERSGKRAKRTYSRKDSNLQSPVIYEQDKGSAHAVDRRLIRWATRACHVAHF
jgi:hypothetical protein